MTTTDRDTLRFALSLTEKQLRFESIRFVLLLAAGVLTAAASMMAVLVLAMPL
jgi:hypothetical protein